MQDVSATPEIVWDRILAFPDYPKMVTGVQECGNYEAKTHRNGTQTIKTRMKLGVMGVSLEYFIEHTAAPKLGVITWTLDPDKDLSIWDVKTHAWATVKGDFGVLVGASSRDIRLTGRIKFDGMVEGV